MAKSKELFYINNRLSGKFLDQNTCNALEKLITLSDNNGCVEDLKRLIYDLPPSTVEIVREQKSTEFVELPIGRLDDYQTVGVAYMYFAKRVLLGDSVGLGKTVEVAALCNLIKEDFKKKNMDFRFLMLTEKTSVSQIRDKMIKFTGEYVETVMGEKKYVSKFIKENQDDVPFSVVGTHSLFNSVDFQQWFIDFMANNGYCPFDILIVDESGDILTNTGTQSYQNGMFFAENFERVICLNATSFEKELNQMYAQLNFVDPSFLPTKTAFQQRYHKLQYGIRKYGIFTGKYQNEAEFMDLVKYRYFSRTRRSTGAEMKDCTAELVVSELSTVQKKLLHIASNPLMVYDCPGYFASSGFQVETNVETTPKLKSLIDLLMGKLKDEKSILVYSRYKEAQYALADTLEQIGIEYRVMNGETPQKTRDAYINSFILGDVRVLVTNVQKGLDFGNCNICIFYDFDPNPNKMVQFEGRMTRSKDIIGKHVYLLVSQGKELKSLKNVVGDRAKASDLFSGSDFSCVLSLLLNSEALGEDVEKVEE